MRASVFIFAGLTVALLFSPTGYAGANIGYAGANIGYAGANIGGTEIAGDVIRTDTTWTAAASPYRIRDAVQVAEGATLTLEPGVSVVGAGAQALFILAGGLNVTGTPDRPVRLDGGQAGAIVGLVSRDVDRVPISISNARMSNAGEFMASSGYAVSVQLTLVDSLLQDLPGDTYLWYPKGDSRIERNVFLRSGGFSVGMRSPSTVLFQHNRFQTAPSSGYWISSWASYDTTLEVRGNAFLAAGTPAVELQRGYSDAAVNARGNYWGTTDPAIVRTMVGDSSTSIDRVGTIPIDPILTSIPSQVPALPFTAPDAPGTPTATAGNKEVRLSWTAPASDGGAAITEYRVTSTPASSGCTTATTTCLVTGLDNGTAYTFQVTATNQIGTSEPSAPSAAITPVGPPGAPTQVLARGATVSFTISDTGGTAILRNEYRVLTKRQWSSWASLGLRQQITIRPCTSRVPVRVQVRSVNAVGAGPGTPVKVTCPRPR